MSQIDPTEAMLPSVAALAVAVAERDKAAVAAILTPLDTHGLYALAITLAANVDLDRPLSSDPAELNPDTIAGRAINVAASIFGTEPMAVVSHSRNRCDLDARAVAMYACRLAGLSSPQTGLRFNRDHTTVLYAWGRVGENGRLRRIAERVAAQCGWTREDGAA